MVSAGSIHGGFRLLAWLFPAQPLQSVTSLTMEELKRKYKWRDRVGNVLGALAFIGLSAVYFAALWKSGEWRVGDYRGAKFVMRPAVFEIALWAAWLSLTSVMVYILVGLRLVLGSAEYRQYVTYGSHRTFPPAPYDVAKAFAFFFGTVFLPSLVLVAMRVDNFTLFTDGSIIHNPFVSIGRLAEHSYSDVRAVYEVRGIHGRFKDINQPYQLVLFGDGTRWQSDRGAGGLKLQYQRDAIRYVSTKSGCAVTPVNFSEDIPH
jgi:hypothetical protein